MNYSWHFIAMTILYLAAGIYHFVNTKLYIRIIPPYIPKPKLMVLLSGAAEILLGLLLLIPYTKIMALWGIIIMLITFIPVHIHMLQDKKFRNKIPGYILWLRLPMQFLLMAWAYSYL